MHTKGGQAVIIVQFNLSSRLLRIKQLRIFFFLCCYFPCLTIAALTPQEIASKAFPSVVVVIAQNSSGEDFAYGSGFFVAPDLVATNLHVIEGAVKVRIRPIGSETESDVTGFTAVDYDNDLVLLKTQVKDGKPLIVTDDSLISIGDDVYVIGNPQGLEGTFSKGMVSGKRNVNNRTILQITAPISQGSSGGPVLSEKAEIIGIAVAYVAEGQNLNFAIPSSSLMALMAKQQDTMPVALFAARNVSKLSPDALEVGQSPIAFGDVLLYLGMPEDEAIKKLERFYNVDPFSTDGNYLVFEKNDSVITAHIGTLYCEKGKLTLISRDLGTTKPQYELISIFKKLVARIQEIQNNDDTFCVIDSRAKNTDSQQGMLSDYSIDLKFDNYTIHISATSLNGDNFFSISEKFKQ